MDDDGVPGVDQWCGGDGYGSCDGADGGGAWWWCGGGDGFAAGDVGYGDGGVDQCEADADACAGGVVDDACAAAGWGAVAGDGGV